MSTDRAGARRGPGDAWQDWVQRSPRAAELWSLWHDGPTHRAALGDEIYRDRLVQSFSEAARRDCAAAGMGCTRRSDRQCIGPDICRGEPEDGSPGVHEGPAPGGCDRFSDGNGYVSVHFSPDDRHRAVLWSDEFLGSGTRRPPGGRRLWVDGQAITVPRRLAGHGSWLENRYFTLQVSGPDDHPDQTYELGELVTTICSLLIQDTGTGTTHLLEPGADDAWTHPHARVVDGALLVFPGRSGAPGRPVPT